MAKLKQLLLDALNHIRDRRNRQDAGRPEHASHNDVHCELFDLPYVVIHFPKDYR